MKGCKEGKTKHGLHSRPQALLSNNVPLMGRRNANCGVGIVGFQEKKIAPRYGTNLSCPTGPPPSRLIS